MFYYAKKDKSEFGVTLEQLRLRIGDPNLSATTTEVGEWVAYRGQNAPEIEWYQYAREVYPVDGVMTWEVVDLSPEEREREEQARLRQMPIYVRNQRKRLLKEHVDSINAMRWEQMSEETRQSWRTYRQELLDVPQQPGFPFEIVWPTQPE